MKRTSIFKRLERFQVKHKKGCWEWTGSKDQHGYGKLSSRHGRSGSPEKAHRVAYEKTNGPIPDGLDICHRCDNPECTNPDHLFAGTAKDNLRDSSCKGRLNPVSQFNLRPGAPGHYGAGLRSNKEVKA